MTSKDRYNFKTVEAKWQEKWLKSKVFKGKTKVQQHKLVYDALEGKMGGVLHALSLTTIISN